MREAHVAARVRKRLSARALPGSLLLAHLPQAYSTAVGRTAESRIASCPEGSTPATSESNGNMRYVHGGSVVLPAWKDALPLWAAEAWLWIELSDRGQVRELYSTDRDGVASLATLEGIRSDMIVVDCRAGGTVPEAWWARLDAALAPGGVIFVCGLRDRGLRGRIARNAPGLRPAAWEVIEPWEDGSWRLRPDSRGARTWSDRHLYPPFGLRTWLRQIGKRWNPLRNGLACLPVWREMDV